MIEDKAAKKGDVNVDLVTVRLCPPPQNDFDLLWQSCVVHVRSLKAAVAFPWAILDPPTATLVLPLPCFCLTFCKSGVN